MASLTRRQRRQRTRVAENASARVRRSAPAKAPRPMPLEPIQLRPIQATAFAVGFLGIIPPSVQADVRLAIAREERELRRLHVDRIGGVLINGIAYDGPRRYSEDDDVELFGRSLEQRPPVLRLANLLEITSRGGSR